MFSGASVFQRLKLELAPCLCSQLPWHGAAASYYSFLAKKCQCGVSPIGALAWTKTRDVYQVHVKQLLDGIVQPQYYRTYFFSMHSNNNRTVL